MQVDMAKGENPFAEGLMQQQEPHQAMEGQPQMPPPLPQDASLSFVMPNAMSAQVQQQSPITRNSTINLKDDQTTLQGPQQSVGSSAEICLQW